MSRGILDVSNSVVTYTSEMWQIVAHHCFDVFKGSKCACVFFSVVCQLSSAQLCLRVLLTRYQVKECLKKSLNFGKNTHLWRILQEILFTDFTILLKSNQSIGRAQYQNPLLYWGRKSHNHNSHNHVLYSLLLNQKQEFDMVYNK